MLTRRIAIRNALAGLAALPFLGGMARTEETETVVTERDFYEMTPELEAIFQSKNLRMSCCRFFFDVDFVFAPGVKINIRNCVFRRCLLDYQHVGPGSIFERNTTLHPATTLKSSQLVNGWRQTKHVIGYTCEPISPMLV